MVRFAQNTTSLYSSTATNNHHPVVLITSCECLVPIVTFLGCSDFGKYMDWDASLEATRKSPTWGEFECSKQLYSGGRGLRQDNAVFEGPETKQA